MRLTQYIVVTVLWCTALNVAGCAPPTTDLHDETNGAHDTHNHPHATIGPNEGHLIELGDEEFHAEWLHDSESGAVTVIMLDSTATQEVAIAAPGVRINVVIDDKPQQYTLDAVKVTGGKASRFRIVAPDLVVALEIGEGVNATLDVEIDGTPYRGEIEHHAHDH